MLYRRQAKRHGRKLARRLRDSLVYRCGGQIVPAQDWTIAGNCSCDESQLERGPYLITIRPNSRFPSIRIFDQVRLAYQGCDVWLPLLQRIRLKNAARLHVTLRALTNS